MNETNPVTPRSLTRQEVSELAEWVRQLFADPDARLTEPTRQPWQGALTALEAVLGEPSSIVEAPDL